MALDHYVVAMTGLGNDDTMPTRLASALRALDRQDGPCQEDAPPPAQRHTLPPRRCSVEEAAMAQGGLSFLYDAMGKVSGEYLWAYPPGVPLVAPGEEVTAELVTACRALEQAGTALKHTGGSGAEEIAVLL